MLSPRLVLVRHGESAWNAEGRLQGQSDPPLSELGRAQAHALAPLLSGFDPARVITSDLARARETASLCGHPDAVPDARFREISVGDWSGKLLTEVDDLPDASWRGGPSTPPGGESWADMVERVGAAVEDLRARGGSWLAVCHGGVVRAALVHLCGVDSQRLGGPANGSITVVDLDRSRPAMRCFAWTPTGLIPGLP